MIKLPYHEKKFVKKTISGYSKEHIIKYMIESIYNNENYLALYCCVELSCSGFFEEILHELFIIICKSCHINSPILPKYYLYLLTYYNTAKKTLDKVLELRNDENFRNYMEMLVIMLCNSSKHYILPKEYQKYFKPMKVFKDEVEEYLKKIKKTLWKLIEYESFNKTKLFEKNIMMYLGLVLNDKECYEDLWNILLDFAKHLKQYKHILEQLGYLYQIFSNVEYSEKFYIFLYAILFFFRGTWIKIKQFKKPKKINHLFYENIKHSVINKTKRIDFINFNKPLQHQLLQHQLQALNILNPQNSESKTTLNILNPQNSESKTTLNIQNPQNSESQPQKEDSDSETAVNIQTPEIVTIQINKIRYGDISKDIKVICE